MKDRRQYYYGKQIIALTLLGNFILDLGQDINSGAASIAVLVADSLLITVALGLIVVFWADYAQVLMLEARANLNRHRATQAELQVLILARQINDLLAGPEK